MPTADPRPFAFPLAHRITLPGRGEAVVVSRSQGLTGPNRYRLSFINGKGKLQQVSLSEPALLDPKAKPNGTKRGRKPARKGK